MHSENSCKGGNRMQKKVLILSASLRNGSNSHALAQQFAKGAQEAGHEVELISLAGKEIGFCRGCLFCQTSGHCVMHDDAEQIVLEKMLHAQVLVFATPIYFYEMSGLMKTLLDRSNPLYTLDYAFREIYLIATAAEQEEETWKRAAAGLQGWIECFPKAAYVKTVFGGGVTDPDDILTSAAMNRAYEAGTMV